ncbi:hypothetical protein [Sulfitobacter pontiacus]|uniref:hypothetical protein n=1 Tax=Sulfitobacter pontiacus TaxID=60137 RepID=UPI00329941DA
MTLTADPLQTAAPLDGAAPLSQFERDFTAKRRAAFRGWLIGTVIFALVFGFAAWIGDFSR